MDQTIKLLKVIGSPFCENNENHLPLNEQEASYLYFYAKKNKIALYYLKSLEERDLLETFGLKENFYKELENHRRQSTTAIRIAELFNIENIDYAIFKSLVPFPGTPNDVDIIHFGSSNEYERAVEVMLKSGYVEVKGKVDTEQRMFHDVKTGGYLNPHPEKKDVFDIDLYQKISASYTIYLDKKKMQKHICYTEFLGHRIRILKPEAELVAIIIHSIIPEMLCTLFVYYATLYHIDGMSYDEINEFLDIARENHVTFSIRSNFSVVAELHKAAHGFIPKKLEFILKKVNWNVNEKNILIKSVYIMPYKYSVSAVSRTLLDKFSDTEFKKSFMKQIIYMSNPKMAKWVINNIILRRQRETY